MRTVVSHGGRGWRLIARHSRPPASMAAPHQRVSCLTIGCRASPSMAPHQRVSCRSAVATKPPCMLTRQPALCVPQRCPAGSLSTSTAAANCEVDDAASTARPAAEAVESPTVDAEEAGKIDRPEVELRQDASPTSTGAAEMEDDDEDDIDDANTAEPEEEDARGAAASFVEQIRTAADDKSRMALLDTIVHEGALDPHIVSAMLNSILDGRESGKSSALGAKQCEHMRQVLDEAETAGLHLNIRLLSNLLIKLYRKDRNKMVLQLALELKDRFWQQLGSSLDTSAFNLVLHLSAKHDPRQTLEVAGTMRDSQVYPNEATYNILIDACSKQGNVEMAMSYLDQMLKLRYTPRAISLIKIIHHCSAVGDIDNARICFHALDAHAGPRGMTIDTGSALALANLAAKIGNLDLISELREHMTNSDAIPANSIWSSPFLHAELEAVLAPSSRADDNNLSNIIETIARFEQAKVPIEWAMLKQVGRILGGTEASVDDAYFKLEQRKEAGLTVPIDAINAVILGCAVLRDVGRAIETFDTINTKAGFDLVPSIRSYHAVLDTCLAADHPQGIISTVNEIKQRKIAPDGPLFNAMICAMAHEGVQDARYLGQIDATIAAMTALKFAPSTAAVVAAAKAFARRRKFRDAWDKVAMLKALGRPVPITLVNFIKNGGK